MPMIIDSTDFGKVYTPGSVMLNGTEGFAKTVFDSNGFNNLQGPGIGPRILVLGDSFSEATQVSQQKNFSRILERRLSSEGADWRVVNCGIAGNSVAEYLFYGDSFRRFFDPDWIIIQVSESDFSDDAFSNDKAIRLARDDKTGKIRVVRAGDNFARDLKNAIVSLSPFSAFAYVKLKSYSRSSEEEGVRQNVVGEASEAGVDQSRENLKQILAKMKTLFGPRLVILEIPDVPRLVGGSVDFKGEVIFSTQLSEACRELDILVADPRDKFVKFFQDERAFPKGFANTRPGRGHLNRDGHELIGEELFETITSFSDK